MRGIWIASIVVLAASALAMAAPVVSWDDISDIAYVADAATVFPSPLDDPGTLLFDNSASLSFSTMPYPTGNAWVNFPLQNSHVAIHSVANTFTWIDDCHCQPTPASTTISDAANVYYTNTRGSVNDPAAQNYFPYNIPRPQADCGQGYTGVYFNLAQTATQFSVYLPCGSNNWGDPAGAYDDYNYNYVGNGGLPRNVCVGVLGPNDTFATATYTTVQISGYCPFVEVTDPAGGIKGVVVVDDPNNTSATFGFMDLYATFAAGSPKYIHAHPGDANNDGKCDVVDLGVLAKYYDSTGLPTSAVDPFGAGSWQKADFNNDGKVDVVDLGALAKNYDWVGTPAVPTPEPMTLSLLAVGGLALIRRKK